MSIGGWTFSKHFSDAVKTNESRHHFIMQIIQHLKQFDIFDHVDLDWEYISPPGQNYGDSGNKSSPLDGQNFALLLQEFDACLKANGLAHITLGMCTTADPARMSALPFDAMSKYLDTINLMTYDFASSSWGPCISTHHTNLYPTNITRLSVHGAVQHLLNIGIDSTKILIGVAFYSRGFANTSGLGNPSSGIVTDKSWEEGVCDYKSLPRPGATEYWDPVAQATFSYDTNKRILNSYDSVPSVVAKCKYVEQFNLGGIIVWESSGDFPVDHPRSLVRAMWDCFSKT